MRFAPTHVEAVDLGDAIDVEQTAEIVIAHLEKHNPGQDWKKLFTDAIAENRQGAADVLIRLADAHQLNIAVPSQDR